MDSEKKFLYQQVYQDIKDKITSAQYQFGDLLPSEREIGEEYHVDRTTVRKAFSLLVDEGLVEKRAGKGSVVISSNSPVSSIPAVSHKGSIAFLLPKSGGVSDRITVPFYSELFYNIEKSCSNAGYSLIYASLDSAEDLGHIQQQTSNLRGIIYVSNVREECIQKALNEHIPCVLLNSYSPLLPSILSDNYSGARKATEYLLQNGHTSIAVLSGIVSYTTSQERLNGVLSVMREHNLSLPDAFYMRSDNWEADGGFNAMYKLLQSGHRLPTAIFCFNDRLAHGAIQALVQSGFSIPDDISIIGYDNSDHARYSVPKLSSIEINVPLMAKATFNSLIDQIATNEVLPIKILAPVSLIERDSVKSLI